MEHVGSTEAIVSGITYLHHLGPTSSNAAIAQHVQTKEQHEERTNNKNRCLNC